MSSFLDANRANWDERADIHVEDLTGAYGIERFLAGEDVLFPIEAAEIMASQPEVALGADGKPLS